MKHALRLKTYSTTLGGCTYVYYKHGYFWFPCKSIEQTSAREESVAQVQQIDSEIGRLQGVIGPAEEKIKKLENSGTGADANIQAQIDKEQERIDKAFERIPSHLIHQNKIIADARATDNVRTNPKIHQTYKMKL